MIADDAHGQSPDELGLEPKLDEIARLDIPQDVFIADLGLSGRGKTNAGFAHAFADNLFQSTKRAADYEQNMLCVDDGGLLFAPLTQIHHSLKLACNVIGCAGRDFRFLHEFEQVRLDATATHIAPGHVLGRGDFVDLVDVNDPVFGAFEIAVGAADKIPNEVLDVAADI